MMGLRMPELLIIGFIAVLLFGGKKLPELGSGLGKSIRAFKSAMEGHDQPQDQGTKAADPAPKS
jgi:sec-independent protein translocase protein TatA